MKLVASRVKYIHVIFHGSLNMEALVLCHLMLIYWPSTIFFSSFQSIFDFVIFSLQLHPHPLHSVYVCHRMCFIIFLQLSIRFCFISNRDGLWNFLSLMSIRQTFQFHLVLLLCSFSSIYSQSMFKLSSYIRVHISFHISISISFFHYNFLFFLLLFLNEKFS